jgi:hypothetical protein
MRRLERLCGIVFSTLWQKREAAMGFRTVLPGPVFGALSRLGATSVARCEWRHTALRSNLPIVSGLELHVVHLPLAEVLLSHPNLQHNPPHSRPFALKDDSPPRAEPLNFTHKLVHSTPYAEVDFLRRDPGFRTSPVWVLSLM